MKKIFIYIAFLFSIAQVNAQAWEIKVEPNQSRDSVWFMSTETSPIKYRYGRGKFVSRATMKSLLAVPSLATIRTIVHDSIALLGVTPGIDDVLAVDGIIQTNTGISGDGNVIYFGNSNAQIRTISATEIRIGDGDNGANANNIVVDDTNNKAYYDNTAHNGSFVINGTSPDGSEALKVVGAIRAFAVSGDADHVHFLTAADDSWEIGETNLLISSTGVYIKIDGLPEYADDTAAGVGGVPTNGLYKTSTGALMIKLP